MNDIYYPDIIKKYNDLTKEERMLIWQKILGCEKFVSWYNDSLSEEEELEDYLLHSPAAGYDLLIDHYVDNENPLGMYRPEAYDIKKEQLLTEG